MRGLGDSADDRRDLLRYLPLILNREKANAMAIAIAMSSPIIHYDFRDAQTILSDLDSKVHAEPRRKGRSVRRIQLSRFPMLIHLLRGLSLHSLQVYIARKYSVLFLQSRKTTDYYKHSYQNYNAYKMKVLGDGTNIGQEKMESIYNNFIKFLAF